MNSKRFFIIITLTGLLMIGLWLPANAANAAPAAQTNPTPTAGADGRILYKVQPGDNCFRVAALNGITIEQLRQLNSNLDENCTLTAGEDLLIGVVSLAGTPTAGPSPTIAPPTATPTPFTGTTEVCVLLFNDINGNSIREDTEPALAGGAVSVTEINGEYSAAQDTAIPADPEAYQGICFTDVPEGKYNITVAIPENFNPTMQINYSLDVNAGDIAFVDFGAQSKDVVADTGNQESGDNPSGGRSSTLGFIGTLFLLGGAGLGYYAWRSGRPESKLSGGGVINKR